MNRRIIGTAILGLGAVLLAIAGFALVTDQNSASGDVAAVEAALRPSVPSLPPATSVDEAESAPEVTETEPPATTPTTPSQSAPMADPTGLRIERLGVEAPIGAYGVDQRTGQMDVPDNVTEVGWYRFGPRPGEPGSAVLAAHVDLAESGPGVFYDLGTLEEGDRIAVLHGDGSETPYRVVARVTYEKEELPLDVIFSREGPPVLTLITCGGAFNTNISRYDSNVVVYAIPDDGAELPAGSSL